MLLFDESVIPSTDKAIMAGLVVSLLGNAYNIIEKVLNRKSTNETNAYTQLTGILQEFKIRDEQKNAIILHQEKDIVALEESNQNVQIKLKKAQLKTMDLQQNMKQVKKSAKFLKVNDSRFNETLDLFESHITDMSEILALQITDIDKTNG